MVKQAGHEEIAEVRARNNRQLLIASDRSREPVQSRQVRVAT